MSVLEIVLYPDPRLRTLAAPVAELDDRIRTLLDDMAETMYAAPGVGLAAPQVGILERVIVVDVGPDEETGTPSRLYKLVNPEIIHREGTISWEEGCLSIPSLKDTVKRSARVVVNALDRDGTPVEIDATGLLSVCLQHEIDHLDGVLFVDRLSRLRRELMKSKLARLAKEQQ